MPYSIAVPELRRPFLSDRYFFIAVCLLRRREKFTEPDFALLARPFNRAWPAQSEALRQPATRGSYLTIMDIQRGR